MSTEEAKQLIQELEKIRRQTRRFRLLTFIALLVIVISGVSAIIESAYSLTLAGPRQEEFVRNLSADLKDNLLPTVQKIAGRSVEALKPAVEKELKEINRRAHGPGGESSRPDRQRHVAKTAGQIAPNVSGRL
jgi:uncharacterized membrane protein YukC